MSPGFPPFQNILIAFFRVVADAAFFFFHFWHGLFLIPDLSSFLRAALPISVLLLVQIAGDPGLGPASPPATRPNSGCCLCLFSDLNC